MILDGRRGNFRFKSPPGVSLLTAEGFARIEVDASLPEGQQSYTFNIIDLATADIKDAFHNFRIPDLLALHFCLPPVRAGAVGLVGLDSDTLVWPMPATLPMGFS